MTGMVEQAHLYFRAAVSAAVLNAMAIAGFVLFMALSSVHGWPLRGLLGLADPVSAPSAASRTIDVSRGLGGAGGFGSFSLPTLSSHSAAGPGSGGAGPSGGGKLSDDPSSGGGQGVSTPGIAPSGTPSPGGPAVGPIGPTPDLPSTPIPPTPPPPSIPQVPQIVGGAVSGLPPTINDSVGTAVGTAGPLGSTAMTSGMSGMLQGASSTLVGPSSPVGNTVIGTGGAVEALGATR